MEIFIGWRIIYLGIPLILVLGVLFLRFKIMFFNIDVNSDTKEWIEVSFAIDIMLGIVLVVLGIMHNSIVGLFGVGLFLNMGFLIFMVKKDIYNKYIKRKDKLKNKKASPSIKKEENKEFHNADKLIKEIQMWEK